MTDELEDAATFTENDLLATLMAAMRHADDGPGDAFTVAELAEKTGETVAHVRKALAELKGRGRLQVCMAKRKRLDDRWVSTAAYRLLANPVEFDGNSSGPGRCTDRGQDAGKTTSVRL